MNAHSLHAQLRAILVLVGFTGVAAAQNAVGVIADRGSPTRQPYAHVFDPGTMQITASVPLPLPNFFPVFDVEISPDLGEAYVSDFVNAAIWVIDLHATPPALATGKNPIDVVAGTSGVMGAVSASASDIALTPDGRFLLVTGGNALGDGGSAMAVVDTATRTVVDTHDFSPNSPTAVEVGPGGSVVVVELLDSQPSSADTNIRRFRIDGNGQLTDTGAAATVTDVPGVQNVIVPSYPGPSGPLMARHVVHISRPAGQTLGSLNKWSLTPRASVRLNFPSGIDVHFDPRRSLVYARTNERPTFGGAGAGKARIDAYLFHPVAGLFGPPIVSIPLDRQAGTAFGVEQTAIDPVLGRVYVSGLGGGEVRVFDSGTGAQVGTITHPSFLFGIGIRVRRR